MQPNDIVERLSMLGKVCAGVIGSDVLEEKARQSDPKVKMLSKRLLELAGNEANNLILIGGAITTPERYGVFEDSLCHLTEDGRIMCYGEQIGTRDDIEIIKKGD